MPTSELLRRCARIMPSGSICELTRGKTPIWNTWYTKCDLGLVDCGTDPPGDKDSPNRLLGSFEVPVQFLEQLSERARVLKNNSSGESHDSELIQVLKQFLIDSD